MDPKIERMIHLINSKKKSNHPWTREQPYHQPYYTHSPTNQKWEAIETPAVSQAPTQSSSPMTSFSLLSWNIDFMLPFPNTRMTTALAYIQSLLSPTSYTSKPTIILLQECLTSDLFLLQRTAWIQQHYYLTDLTDSHWESGHYGTCTLIPKSLGQTTSVFRVHYTHTEMERDALFVDISLSPTTTTSSSGTPSTPTSRVLRICNTHLESLIATPPKRDKQLAVAARYMHGHSSSASPLPQPHASVLAGDLNAIQPFDAHLHTDNDLHDAYLSSGGTEGDEEGMTWGQMAPTKLRERFGLSRMDKVFYCGGVRVERWERVGLEVEIGQTWDIDGTTEELGVEMREGRPEWQPERAAEQKLDLEEMKRVIVEEEGCERPWVTDHCGVRVDFVIE